MLGKLIVRSYNFRVRSIIFECLSCYVFQFVLFEMRNRLSASGKWDVGLLFRTGHLIFASPQVPVMRRRFCINSVVDNTLSLSYCYRREFFIFWENADFSCSGFCSCRIVLAVLDLFGFSRISGGFECLNGITQKNTFTCCRAKFSVSTFGLNSFFRCCRLAI